MPLCKQGAAVLSFDADKRLLPDSLEQDNFNLKLRIYHLEERLVQQYPGDIGELVRLNAELNAQLEIKNDAVQQRDLLLVKARNVIETLQNDVELLKATNGVKSGNERITSQEEMRRSSSMINQLSSKLQDCEQKLKSAEAELRFATNQSNAMAEQLVHKKAEYDAARDRLAQFDQFVGEKNYLKGTIDKLQQQLAESMNNCSNLKDNLSTCLLKLQDNDALKTRLENDLAEAHAEVKKAAERNANAYDRLQKAETEANQNHVALIELENSYRESQSQIAHLKHDLIAFSKREASLLDELQKWKTVLQSQHEDKQNIEHSHQQSMEKVQVQFSASIVNLSTQQAGTQKSVQAYSDTLRRLSSAFDRVVQCLHCLRVPAIPLHAQYDGDELLKLYNDDNHPPTLDVNDPDQASLTAVWIERKLQRIARIRSSLKLTISQVEERWKEQFNRLEHMIKLQGNVVQDLMLRLRKVYHPDRAENGWPFAEERLHKIARELDKQLTTRN